MEVSREPLWVASGQRLAKNAFYIDVALSGLSQLADRGLQERLWLGGSEEASSIEEAIEQTFGDSNLGAVLEREDGKARLGPDAHQSLLSLRSCVRGLPYGQDQAELVASPAMDGVRKLATRARSEVEALRLRSPTEERAAMVRDLIAYRADPQLLAAEINERFGRDCDEALAEISARDVRRMLGGFMNREIEASVVEDWADAIECRDDIEFASPRVREMMHVLANPALEGPLTSDRVADLRLKLLED